jgi:O-antigen/teichoic acid export membrane protein
MHKQILKSTSIGLINKLAAAIASFILLPIFLKKLGTETYGIWMTIISTVGILGFLDLGIGATLINFISTHTDRIIIARYIKTAYLIQFYFIGAVLLLFVGGFFLSTGVMSSIFLMSHKTYTSLF